MTTDGSSFPQEPDRPTRSWFTHPLLLALIPAVTAIVVAIVTINANNDSGPPSAAAPHGPDVTLRVDRDVDGYDDGWEVAFDGELPSGSDAATSGGSESLYQWAATRGAVDVRLSHFRLYVENNRDTRLTIRDVRARVEKRRPDPIAQTLVRSPSAGANELVGLLFPLDREDVVDAQTPSQDALPQPTGKFFGTKNITLDPGETIDLKLIVTARECFCRYLFELDILVASSRQTIEVRDDAGDLFATTGPSASYDEQWENGSLGCNRSGLFEVKASGLDCTRPASNSSAS